jgi:hypothetical protein
VLCFVLTGPVFPVGYALARLGGGDLFAKSPTLTPLGIRLAALQIFHWPVIIVVFHDATDWTPFAMAVLFGSHFLPYGWLYRSPAYFLLTVSVTVVLSGAVLVAGDPLYLQVSLLTAACSAVAVAMMWLELRSLRSEPAAA